MVETDFGEFEIIKDDENVFNVSDFNKKYVEILGKYEDAIKYVELQIKYLEEEWNITEGADVDALQEEKRRLIEKIK